jgi:putative membrane protein
MFLYLKALHIVFIVTWFAGLFYIVRLFIYNTEANAKPLVEKEVLQQQFGVMMSRLWFGITWPSAVLTAILGPLVMYLGNWHRLLGEEGGRWLLIKLFFVAGLYGYHVTLHALYRQQAAGVFKYSSQQLRVWNEVATIFLVAIVMLATVKQSISFVWGLLGLVGFVIILMSAIRIYKSLRKG